jgi:2-C-methyl-D-erythritol 4-phosphate cytidylyltransferase
MISAVVVAAGKSRRMGADKLSLLLCGKPVFLYSLEALQAHDEVSEIILVSRLENQSLLQEKAQTAGVTKIRHWVEGGEERQHSVWQGLQKVDAQSELVLIHDAARPFLSPTLIDEVAQAARAMGAAVCGSKVVDTIKEVDEKQQVVKTLKRESLLAVQTPQIFQRSIIQEAYKSLMQTQEMLTDDTAVVERLGKPVQVVLFSGINLKITTPEDLVLAEAFLKKKRSIIF